MFARHGARHPFGEGFSGSQDLVSHAIDEQTAVSYTAQVLPPASREVFLSGTPDEAIDQAAQWRDQGARYVWSQTSAHFSAVCVRGLSAARPFARILHGLNKL